MAQIVDPHIRDASRAPDFLPSRLQRLEVLSLQMPDDDPWAIGDPRNGLQDLDRLLIEDDRLLTGLAIRQEKQASLKIDVCPLEGQDLAKPCTREDKQADARHCGRHDRTRRFEVAQDLSDTQEFFGGEEAFELSHRPHAPFNA